MCDTDSFGSRLSGNGGNGNGIAHDYNSASTGKHHHIKEEIENDEDYFQLLANQTRAMRHLDGKKSSQFGSGKKREKMLQRNFFTIRT